MSIRRRGALVGLDELIAAQSEAPVVPDQKRATLHAWDIGRVVDIPLKSIQPSAHQPRERFDDDDMAQLTESIREHGRVLQPILVRPAGVRDDGKPRYELIAGERRKRAAEFAGQATIRALIEDVDDATSARMALIENMVRADLNPIEEAAGCLALHGEFGMSKAAIGKMIGRDRARVSELIKFLDLPDEAKVFIAAGELSEGHGRVLLTIDGYIEQREFAERCASEGWSVRELEQQRDDAKVRRGTVEAARAASRTVQADAVAERYTEAFSAVTGLALRVRVSTKGAVTIHAKDIDTAREFALLLGVSALDLDEQSNPGA